MRGVSDRFLRTLRGSHRAIVRARVCQTFQTGSNPVGIELAVIDGSVTSSSSDDVRSKLNITVSEKWPLATNDLLMPYGNEIFVERGIEYGNGQREWVGLGYYRIDTDQQETVPDGPITLQCPDRMQGVIDAQFTSPRQFAATVTRRQMTASLLTDVYPDVQIIWDDALVADAPIGRSVIEDVDRFGMLSALMTSLGKVGYFDYRGIFVVSTAPSVTGSPSWTVDAGQNGVMTKMSRNLTRQGVKNIFVVIGDGADTAFPVRAVVGDYGPNSPTRVGGRFGPVPGFFSNPLVLDNAQARTAGTELLKKSLGLPYQVTLGAVFNSAVEVNDVVAVRYPNRSRSRTLRTEIHVLDDVTIPLSVESEIALQTRQQPVIVIGDYTA
jgi:hypothetical protein